ncbi:WxL domain-containing protein [Enterococcus faecalis]|uniref:WxL domain-containing protein n=1 Tax=Enterococcus faecalis TaxID=1351 RepID=UPI001142864A|nr:WxL domain-containing protein [Enterococcus faecalis]MBP4091885.1 WxL domain-containing protein [Enterococcus faecalis]MBP4103833.1 WxL domain-containing protein [Enterococcus faecalis]NSV83886.1 WxL domain-containing protein [Enterococcus faecalis]TQA93494.1 WxL domain-containing protein [Enterococcus faecalis]
MKKKLLASLLVSSAVVGASLAPLSAQATTTGKTPVTVGFEGGTLPDGNGDPNTVRPDPDASNSNFDLLFIPKGLNFGKLSISDDLTKPIPTQVDESVAGMREAVGVGDLRGTKEGWHVTAQSSGLVSGSEKLAGNINVAGIAVFNLIYDKDTNTYINGAAADTNPVEVTPNLPVYLNWKLDLGGDAQLLMNATSGKGQGLWKAGLRDVILNLTTTANEIKAGNYTGNITWNLVAGPSTPAPSN